MHSRAVELAASNDLDVVVRGTFSAEPGTTILGRSADMLETQGPVTAVAHDMNIAMALTRSDHARDGLAADILTELARSAVPIDLLSFGAPDGPGFRMGFALPGSLLRPPRGRPSTGSAPDWAVRRRWTRRPARSRWWGWAS